jgi:hypothetical protein
MDGPRNNLDEIRRKTYLQANAALRSESKKPKAGVRHTTTPPLYRRVLIMIFDFNRDLILKLAHRTPQNPYIHLSLVSAT